MVSINKNILRSLLILSFIALNALIIFGISALFTYLNTGADRSKMLHTEIKKVDQYLPKMDWASLKNEGRPISEQTLIEIENDYLDAWYVKHIAYKTNQKAGIKDYYTENARKNIYQYVDLNKKENVTVESTTLNHNPTLEFYSEDGQLAVLTDENVKEYKRIYKENNLILEANESATYKVILLLEDGFWRIRHMVKEDIIKSDTIDVNKVSDFNETYQNLKGINYYPQKTPWDMFGDKFDIDVISKDLKLISKTGLNSIRIFVPYEDFGKAHVKPEKLEKLKQVMDAADSNQLKVMVTLFDFYGDYSVLDWTLNQRHAETIVSQFKNHNALLAWDIKNEPNLDFESRKETKVISWLKHMIQLVKSIDQNHPVTIGWSDAESANILKDELDFISFHYYQKIDNLESIYQSLKTEIPTKPVVITEFGKSSYSGLWNLYSGSEKDQADYYQTIQNIFSKNNMSFMSWTLYDFSEIPKEVVGRLPWRKEAQKHFGFISENGETKPAFKYIFKE